MRGRGLSVDMGLLSGSLVMNTSLPVMRYEVYSVLPYQEINHPSLVEVRVDGNDAMHATVVSRSGKKVAEVDFDAEIPTWLQIILDDAARRYEMEH